MVFKPKEGLAQQRLQYEVIAGAYLPAAEPRPLSREALTLLIPAVLAEQARRCCCFLEPWQRPNFNPVLHPAVTPCGTQHQPKQLSACATRMQHCVMRICWQAAGPTACDSAACQVLHLQPQGRCLNAPDARRGRSQRRPSLPAVALAADASLQDVWEAFRATGVAFLDTQKMSLQPEAGLTDAGPAACLAGELTLAPGQLGAPSQASTSCISTVRPPLHWDAALMHCCPTACRGERLHAWHVVPSCHGTWCHPAMQVIFHLGHRHTRQLRSYHAPSACYQPLHYAQPLTSSCVALMLPSAVALDVTHPHAHPLTVCLQPRRTLVS